MTDPFHLCRRLGTRLTWGLLILALRGRATLLGGPLFCRLFLFFMHFLKIYFFFYLSYPLRLLLNVIGDIESNPGPSSDRRVRVLFSNIRGPHAHLDELAVSASDYDVLVCAESKVSDCAISQSSVSLALIAPNTG